MVDSKAINEGRHCCRLSSEKGVEVGQFLPYRGLVGLPRKEVIQGSLLQHQVVNDGSIERSEPIGNRAVGREDGINLIDSKAIDEGRHCCRLSSEKGVEVGQFLPLKRAG